MQMATLLVALGLTVPAVAETGQKLNQGINESAKDGAITQTAQNHAASDLALSAELARYGHDAKNPMALLVAAQIIKNNPTKDVKLDKKSDGETSGDSGTGKKGSLITAAGLLDEAKSLAADDLQMVALIDAEVKSQGGRGAVTGVTRHVDRIKAGDTDNYKVVFKGHQEANVVILGDGDNDLDLYVYDENGNLVGKDLDGSDKCLVTWTPARTGDFRIKIKNLGKKVYSDYILLTD